MIYDNMDDYGYILLVNKNKYIYILHKHHILQLEDAQGWWFCDFTKTFVNHQL